jgi:Nuclear transport factor 2 (NTF2) domain
MSADEIASAFVNHFYTTLNSNASALAGLYQAQSTMTFEGAKSEGPEAIVGKYVVSFQRSLSPSL